MRPTFTYAEDYLLFMGGIVDHRGNNIYAKTPLSLARYDVKVLNSFCGQIRAGKAFTDRQCQLAYKLMRTYQRQLTQQSPPVILPDQDPPFKLPLRQIDRSRYARINNGVLELKFPFDTEMISALRTQRERGFGHCKFVQDKFLWQLAITESNLNWLVTISEVHNITLDPTIRDLYQQMMLVEQTPHVIELVAQGEGYTVSNAAPSLLNYIEAHLGGFGSNNLLKLVDNAVVLGYSVSDELVTRAVQGLPQPIRALVLNRETTLNAKSDTEHVKTYAELTNRLPMCVYDVNRDNSDRENVILMNREVPPNMPMRLFITYSRLMIGTRKQSWLNKAEKIVNME